MSDGTWEIPGGETVFAPAAIWESGYAEGVQDSMLRATQIERILTDLIAELWIVNSEADLPPFYDMADRAEERLQKLDTPPHSTNEHNNLGGGRR